MKERTNLAVLAQITAMGCELFEVGVFDSNKGRMLTKVWDKETILRSISYLKYQNMQGKHIYIRPKGAHSLALIDDLTAANVKRLHKDGFSPAVLVETSPKNFQVWLKHDRILPTNISTRVSRELASRYGGDPGSADWRHYGRLAGFTNCKSKHRQSNSLYPFVILKSANGLEYGKTDILLADVLARVEAEQREIQTRRRHFSAISSSPASNAFKTINDFRHDPRYGGDQHRAELGYATYAVARGLCEQEIIAAIMTRDLAHKGSSERQLEYAERTVKKAQKIAL